MYYQSEFVHDAWAFIKGKTETDLMQSISYAAHMIYKKSEQDYLNAKGGKKR